MPVSLDGVYPLQSRSNFAFVCGRLCSISLVQVGDRVKMQPEKALNGQFHAVTSVCTNATAYLQLDFHGLQKDDIVA